MNKVRKSLLLADNKKRPRLFLSRVDKDYDPDCDFVLGPWCFLGREKKHPDWDKGTFLDAFDGPEEKKQAAGECAKLAAFIVGQLATRLNKSHLRDYPYEYWWTLLIRWSLTLVHAYWRRWIHITKFIEKFGDIPFRVVVDLRGAQIDLRFETTASFVYNGLLNEKFDFLIQSMMVSKLAPAGWFLDALETNGTVIKNAPIPDVPNKTNIARRFIRKQLGHLPFSDVPGVGPFGTILFSIYLNLLRKKNVSNEFYGIRQVNPPKYFPQIFIKLIEEISFSFLPLSFSSDFPIYEKKAQNYTFKKGRLFVTGCTHIKDTNNFEIAHALLNGERVVRCQHGSDYGTLDNTFLEALNEYCNTAFLSWGWEVHGNFEGRFIPTPSPLLSKVQNNHVQKNDNIILVGCLIRSHSVSIDQTPEPSFSIGFRNAKRKFVSALNEKATNNLMYRPYLRGSMDLEDLRQFKQYFPQVPILEEDLHEHMLGCSLLVLDQPGTTLNVAMAMGVPFICYWENGAWPINEKAEPYFEALRDAEILFFNPIDAASMVNEVSNKVEKWWSTSPVQEARNLWANQFALANQFWCLDWFHTMEKI